MKWGRMGPCGPDPSPPAALSHGSSRSVRIGADHLAPGHGAEGPPGVAVDGAFDEPDRAVAEGDVHAAGVTAAGGDGVVVAVGVVAAEAAVEGVGRHDVVVPGLARAAPPPGGA